MEQLPRQEIKIDIGNGESAPEFSLSGSSVEGYTSSINKIIKNIQHPAKTIVSQIANSKAMPFISLAGQVSSTGIRVATLEMNRYFTLKEDYIAQNKVNMLNQGISTINSIASSATSNMMVGARFGVLGAIGGLAFGTVKGFFDASTAAYQKKEAYEQELSTTNIRTAFSASRASLVSTGHATEN